MLLIRMSNLNDSFVALGLLTLLIATPAIASIDLYIFIQI